MSLPKGWILSKLGEVTSSKKGKKPKQLTVEKLKDTVPYIDIRAFEKGEIRQYADIESSVLIDEKDILIVWDGARSGLVGSNISGALGSTLVKIYTTSIDKEYLFYFLKSKFHDINKNTKGTGIPHVNPKYLWDLDFPYPPIPEQKQIVKKLDKLLARVEHIKTVLDNAPTKIKRFRQSVLSSAVGGELIKNITFNKLPLNKLGSISGGKTPSKSNLEYWTEGSVFWVSAKDMKRFEIDSSIDKITDKAVAEAKMKLIPINSILMVTRSGILAHTFPIAINTKEITINQDLKAFNVNSKIVNYKFLAYVLKGESQSILTKCSKDGTTVPSVSTEKLMDYKLNIPNLKEQKAIVKKVEALFAIADKMEANIAKAQKQVDRLTQSILAKAFRGEL